MQGMSGRKSQREDRILQEIEIKRIQNLTGDKDKKNPEPHRRAKRESTTLQ
jgi:hypothetical protein